MSDRVENGSPVDKDLWSMLSLDWQSDGHGSEGRDAEPLLPWSATEWQKAAGVFTSDLKRAGDAARSFLPGLVLADARDGGNDGAPVQRPAASEKSAADAYTEREHKRAADYAAAHDKGTTLERSVLTFAALPEKIKITSKPGLIKLESNNFAKIVEAIPGVKLNQPLRTILESIKSAGAEGNKVKVEARFTLPVDLGKGLPVATLTVDSPSFDIVPDRTNPNRLNLENIQGISISALGAGGDIKRISLTLSRDADENPVLKLEIARPAAKVDAAPNDYLAKLKQGFNRAANEVIPEVTTIAVPIGTKEDAATVERIFKSVREYVIAPEKNDPAKMAAGIAGVDLQSVLGGALDGISGVSKNGDRIEITTKQATTHDLGGLPVQLAEVVRARMSADLENPKLDGVEGVTLNLPLPPEVARAIGTENPVKAALKEVSFGEPDKDGNRILTVKTDSLLDSVRIKVGSDMKPIPADKKGNIAIDFMVKRGDASLPLTVTFDPAQLEKPPATGPDFTIAIKGKDSDYIKLIETMTGAKLDQPVRDLVSGVTSVTKDGDRIRIVREKNTTHDLGGVALEASGRIEMKVASDKGGVRISDIQGISLKVPLDLPKVVKDLGIDPGSHIRANLRTISLSDADGAGRRKLVFETDHIFRKVGLQLGPDMKPVLDGSGNWYLYGFVDNPVANKQLPLILRFDRNNQLNMSTQELMRIGSQASWQAADGSPAGIGFGIVAVGTEVGAMALDAKDKVVEGAVIVKDAVVDGAVIVKDVAVTGAVVVKDAAVNGATIVKNAAVDGAATVGGWVKDAWKSIFD